MTRKTDKGIPQKYMFSIQPKTMHGGFKNLLCFCFMKPRTPSKQVQANPAARFHYLKLFSFQPAEVIWHKVTFKTNCKME